MPVLPDVGSMMTESALMTPRRSASSIIASPMRSLTLPPGFARSILVHTVTRGSNSLLIRTCGVLPIVSRTLSKITWVPFPCLPVPSDDGAPWRRSDDEVDGVRHLRDRADPDLALVVHERPRWHRVGEPDVAADDRIRADDRVAAENRRVRVDHHAILDRGVALRAGRLLHDRERTERDALVQLHVVADDCRLADHEAGAVVDA